MALRDSTQAGSCPARTRWWLAAPLALGAVALLPWLSKAARHAWLHRPKVRA